MANSRRPLSPTWNAGQPADSGTWLPHAVKPEELLICWTRNWYRDPVTGDAAIITHVNDMNRDGFYGLCGVALAETGWAVMSEGHEPGCVRCRNALRRAGLMSAKT